MSDKLFIVSFFLFNGEKQNINLLRNIFFFSEILNEKTLHKNKFLKVNIEKFIVKFIIRYILCNLEVTENEKIILRFMFWTKSRNINKKLDFVVSKTLT